MNPHPQPWRSLTRGLAEVGLNAVGVADGAPYQERLEGCRSAVVVGSGGPALWQALVAQIQQDPTTLSAHHHPLDDFVRARVQHIDAAVFGASGPQRVWAFADVNEPKPVLIQQLAIDAGLGWRSRLHLVLSPRFGTWMGLRAVCFTTALLPPTQALSAPSPCDGCPAPCVSACPGRAMAQQQMDWKWCTVQRVTTTTCLDACHARAACPEGAEHRYDALEHGYHHDKRRGRAAWAQALGIADPQPPPGVDWAARLADARRRLSRQ